MKSKPQTLDHRLRPYLGVSNIGNPFPLKEAVEYLNLRPPAKGLIHVAGTNGKGSLCEFLFQNLREEKVALFTSPHLESVCERIRTPQEAISNEDFHLHLDTIEKSLPNELKNQAGYFVLTLLVFLLHANHMNCEYHILEAGLGGAKDPTNYLGPKIACALTSIGLDHTETLGTTKEEILIDKIRISRTGIPLYVTNEIYGIDKIREFCKIRKIPLKCIQTKTEQKSPFGYDLLANQICQDLGIAISNHESKALAGRQEIIENRILLDVAHNPQSFETLLQTISGSPFSKQLYLCLAKSKDLGSILHLVCEHFDAIAIITGLPGTRNFWIAEDIESIVPSSLSKKLSYLSFSAFMANANQLKDCTVAGSFQLMGPLRQSFWNLIQKENDQIMDGQY